VCVRARDTRSDLRGGLQAARELLDYGEVLGLLGPQDDDLALRTVELIRQRQVVAISGGVTAPSLRFAVDDGLWFRTVPSAVVQGPALAQRMFEDGARHMSVLYEGTEFGSGWATVLEVSFTTLGGISHGVFSFSDEQRTFGEVLERAFAPEVEAVVLVASPGRGAAVVEEWATSGRGRRWYFVPALADPVFVENIPPGAVDGMIGIVPALGDHARVLHEAYAERWQGEAATRGAHFYYDALLLWALAHEAARAAGSVDGGAVARALRAVAGPPGERVGYQDLARAFERVRAGEDIDLVGASGELDLDEYGDVRGARTEFWTVAQGQVVFP
jgi:neutral amino acid transport system substrate-binding protein